MEEVKTCEQVKVMYTCPHCEQEMTRPVPVESGVWSCFRCGGFFTIPTHFYQPLVDTDDGASAVNFGSLERQMGDRVPQST